MTPGDQATQVEQFLATSGGARFWHEGGAAAALALRRGCLLPCAHGRAGTRAKPLIAMESA